MLDKVLCAGFLGRVYCSDLGFTLITFNWCILSRDPHSLENLEYAEEYAHCASRLDMKFTTRGRFLRIAHFFPFRNVFGPAAGGGVAPPPLLWFQRSLTDADMEIPRFLPARGTLQGGGGGGGPAGGRQDGGPGRRRKPTRAASPGPGPSLLAPRPDHAGGGDDFFLLLLDPVGGHVETAGAGQATGPVWREEAAPGPGLQGRESGANPAGRPELGPCCPSASPAPAPAPIRPPSPGPAAAFAGTVTIHNQDLLWRFENGVLTLATPPPPAWEPGVAPAPQVGGLIIPQPGEPHATQPGDCPELPPDLLLAEPPEPAPAPAPEEGAESLAAAEGPRGSLGPGSSMVLYVCPEAQCGQTFAKKHQLKVHLLTHSSSQGQRPFKCPLGGCGWTFTTSYKLKRHLQSHDKLRPFGCPAEGCGKSFTTVYNLKAHMKGHEQENSFKCEVCEESFPTQAKLSVHQRSHFEPERPYQCAFSGCKKTFITVSALFSHNRAHFREQELFSCSFPGCSKQYDKACRLKIHLRSHTGERPFLCDFDGCGWNFTSMSKLLRHKRKHEDDRRFTCPVEGCGKSFTRAEHLKGHSITHLGTKPFVCPVEGCCARFSARSSLYIHSKKHLQDVDTWKSRCPVSTCNKLFTSKHSMKTHMAKRHNLGQDLLAQLEASNSLTPSSELISQGQGDVSDADLVPLFSDVPGSSSAAMLDTALVNSGILTIDVASVSSTLAGNLPPNNNSLGQAMDRRASMATSDLPQSLDTSLFFGTTATGFQQSTLDMDDVPSVSAGPLGSLPIKNSSQEPQALTPSNKLTVDTDALTPSSALCDNSVSALLTPTKVEWNVHPDSDFFEREEETPFGFSSPAGNHSSQKETDLTTVTGSAFLV
ncbi:zinc finger X-linked protein ZXDB [Trichechus manatus latirostris]|uniref:Zinc finger X-linked protein ZXDB n=1 Tax=Trichechus manatus latirostris TaxID=127582 RepID=A0A2Y9RIY5_TRIMA|nr:zinc finger X-linked protein ZXDB [Trichechus manatus latirostris]